MFALNNPKVDYIKQAVYTAKKLKELTGLDSCLVTDAIGYLERIAPDYEDYFCKVISSRTLNLKLKSSNKRYHDGNKSYHLLPFQNEFRVCSYELSPFLKTLVIDTDILWNNTEIFRVFKNSHHTVSLYKDCISLNPYTDVTEFETINEQGVDFYWATCVYFEKNNKSKLFFDILKHVYNNWNYYKTLYHIKNKVYRNDIAFSIAIHLVNNMECNTFVGELPGTLYYSIDRDILMKKDGRTGILLDKGFDYTYTRLEKENIHVMNKFSLGRYIDDSE